MGDILTVEHNSAARRPVAVNAHDDVGKRRLACPVFSKDAVYLGIADFQVQAIKYRRSIHIQYQILYMKHTLPPDYPVQPFVTVFEPAVSSLSV
jgi:hypothetical protein